jgi:hypothetical protein
MDDGMRIGKALRATSMIGGSIALTGIIVGLYSQILPEHNPLIRYSEIGFFSFCIPFLLAEAWGTLKSLKLEYSTLLGVLAFATSGLVGFLFLAEMDGGVLTVELLIVVLLLAVLIAIAVIGSESIRLGLKRMGVQGKTSFSF